MHHHKVQLRVAELVQKFGSKDNSMAVRRGRFTFLVD